MHYKIIFALLILAGAASASDCESDLDSGPCRAFFEVWGFNPYTNECEPFIYGGCQGNGNRYQSLAQCEQTCRI